MKMTKEQIKKHEKNPNILLKVNGKSFRCHCGCNVFHHNEEYDTDIFECNSCHEIYSSKE